MNDFASKLMSLDRRVLYALLLGIILFGLLVPINLPLTKAAPAQKLFEAIEAAPTDKLAFVSTAWTNSTRGENAPQMAALMRHLMRRKIKFALIQFGNPEAVVLDLFQSGRNIARARGHAASHRDQRKQQVVE